MRILINASNIRGGGGEQVTDSICHSLDAFGEHHFIVVLSSALRQTAKEIKDYANVDVYEYNIKNNIPTIVFGRDRFLDGLVKDQSVDAVLTVFGPSRWIPKVFHLSGFARAQILNMESPYRSMISFREKLRNRIVKWSFNRCADYYWTENSIVSDLLKELFPKKKVFTVGNTYNQIFDHPDRWTSYPLSEFTGTNILVISSANNHKNSGITVPVAEYLKKTYPNFKFRFIITVSREAFPHFPAGLDKHFEFIGKVKLSELPFLYSHADILFQPSLLECFSSTYPEAMKMGLPIVTTDLPFSKSICGDSALYYSCLGPEDAGDCIRSLYKDSMIKEKLILEGAKRLAMFPSTINRIQVLLLIIKNFK